MNTQSKLLRINRITEFILHRYCRPLAVVPVLALLAVPAALVAKEWQPDKGGEYIWGEIDLKGSPVTDLSQLKIGSAPSVITSGCLDGSGSCTTATNLKKALENYDQKPNNDNLLAFNNALQAFNTDENIAKITFKESTTLVSRLPAFSSLDGGKALIINVTNGNLLTFSEQYKPHPVTDIITFNGDTVFKNITSREEYIIDSRGIINFNGSATFTQNQRSWRDGGGAILNSGTINFNGPATFTQNEIEDGNFGTIENTGTINFNGNTVFAKNSFDRVGTIHNDGAGKLNFIVKNKNDTVLFSGNKPSYGYGTYHNSIYFGRWNDEGTGTMRIYGAGEVDMRDPMRGFNPDVNISKYGEGVWKLGGKNIFHMYNTAEFKLPGNVNFIIAGGTLWLYGEGEAENCGEESDSGCGVNVSSGIINLETNHDNVFKLADTAKLSLGDEHNKISADGIDGKIIFGDATIEGHSTLVNDGKMKLTLLTENNAHTTIEKDKTLTLFADTGQMITLAGDGFGESGEGKAANVAKSGAGTVIFNTANTYSGSTTVKAGNLFIGDAGNTRSSIASDIIVQSGATFGGYGTAGGTDKSVIIEHGAFLSPGASADRLKNIDGTPAPFIIGGNLVIHDGARLNYSFDELGNGDTLDVKGAVTLGDAGGDSDSAPVLYLLPGATPVTGQQKYTVIKSAQPVTVNNRFKVVGDLAFWKIVPFEIDYTTEAEPYEVSFSLMTHREAERLEEERQEAARQEAARQEEARQEAARQEEARQEAARQEEARQEAARQEAARQEAARQEEARQEAARQEAARQEEARQEAARQEEARQEAARQEEARQEAARQEAARQEEARQEAARQEEARQEAARQEEARQEAARQEAARQEALRLEKERQEAEKQAEADFIVPRVICNADGSACVLDLSDAQLAYQQAATTVIDKSIHLQTIALDSKNLQSRDTLVLNGTDNVLKSLQISAGTVRVGDRGHAEAGLMVSEGLRVVSGGTLAGYGTVYGDVLIDGGRLAPGGSIGTLNIDGSLTLNDGVYDFDIAADGSSDQVAVTGKVRVNGGRLHFIPSAGVAGDWSTPFTLITASQGIEGRFRLDPDDDELAFLNISLPQGDYGSRFTVTVSPKFSSHLAQRALVRQYGREAAASQPNRKAVAYSLAMLPDNSLILGQGLTETAMNKAQVTAAFDNLTPDIHASASSVLLFNSHYIRDAVFSGKAAGDGDVWLHSWRHSGSFAGSRSRVSASGYGLVAGAESAITPALRGGLLAGYERANISSHNAAAATSRFSLVHAGGYLDWRSTVVNVRGGLVYSWMQGDTRRRLSMPSWVLSGTTGTQNNSHGGQMQVFGEVSRPVPLAGAARLTPYGRLAYVHQQMRGVKESGSAAAVVTDSQRQGVAFSEVGLRGEFELPAPLPASLYAAAGWQHTYGTTGGSVTSRFSEAQAENKFTVNGVSVPRDSAQVNAGVVMRFSPHNTLTLSYQGGFARYATDHAGKIHWQVSF